MPIFIPQTILVGYNKREDTYTGKLGYIIYLDQKGKIRKEASWNSWRDHKIDSTKLENVPMSGFVLNKKVGGNNYSWNPRQTYCRVFDPRGFEFEIIIPNLLYILENTSSIKGKGLEGEFVYGWDGKELVLIPVDAPEYVQHSNFSKMLIDPEKILGKDLVPGATYRTNRDQIWTYLGRFDYHEAPNYYSSIEKLEEELNKPPVKKYFFLTEDRQNYEFLKTPNQRITKLESIDPVPYYAEEMLKLEYKSFYSPIDWENCKYLPLEPTERRGNRFPTFIRLDDGRMISVYVDFWRHYSRIEIGYEYTGHPDLYRNREIIDDLTRQIRNAGTVQELEKIFPLYKQIQYLKNGKKRK